MVSLLPVTGCNATSFSSDALALATKRVTRQVRELGVQAFLRWVRESCAHRWLRPA